MKKRCEFLGKLFYDCISEEALTPLDVEVLHVHWRDGCARNERVT